MNIKVFSSTITQYPKLNNKLKNSPSFGYNKIMGEDTISPMLFYDLETPEILLKKVKKSDNNAKGMNELFLAIIKEREIELDIVKKQKMTDILFEKQYDASNLLTLTEDSKMLSTQEKKNIETIVKSNIEKTNEELHKLNKEVTRPADFKKLKTLKKIAKEIVKKASFDPNYIDNNGVGLINHTLSTGDDELSLMLMHHNAFDYPISFRTDAEKERYEKLSKKLIVKNFLSSCFM